MPGRYPTAQRAAAWPGEQQRSRVAGREHAGPL